MHQKRRNPPGGTAGFAVDHHCTGDAREDAHDFQSRQGAALGLAVDHFDAAHRLFVAGLMLADEAGLADVAPEMAADLGEFADAFARYADSYGHARAFAEFTKGYAA